MLCTNSLGWWLTSIFLLTFASPQRYITIIFAPMILPCLGHKLHWSISPPFKWHSMILLVVNISLLLWHPANFNLKKIFVTKYTHALISRYKIRQPEQKNFQPKGTSTETNTGGWVECSLGSGTTLSKELSKLAL